MKILELLDAIEFWAENNPELEVKFATSPFGSYDVVSIYENDKNILWVDLMELENDE